MKLIKEYIIKEFILFIVALLIIEGFIYFWLSKRETIIYNETYNDTLNKIINKTKEVSKKFEEFTINYLSKYLTDLKTIAIHSILFNINNTKETYLNTSNKMIKRATLEDKLKDIPFDLPVKDMDGNLYIDGFEREFGNITDTNIILRTFFETNKFPELNIIGYYNPDRKNLTEDEENNIKNIMCIFKSLLIKRYITKRKNLDYIRFIIFDKDKMFIYPTNIYNLTHSYFFNNINLDANCNNDTNKFPICYYNYVYNKYYLPVSKKIHINPNNINFLTITKEKMDLQKCYGSVCIRMKYLKNQIDPAMICIEIDFSKLFRTSIINIVDKYDFGMFTIEYENYPFPIININEKLYDNMIEYFNNSKIEHENHKLFTIKQYKLLTFFHLLYYNLSICIEKNKLEINWDEIDVEYNEIINQMINKINEFNHSEKFIIFDFNKTICQKKLLQRGYEIIKDQFKMIITPVSFKIKLLDNNYMEYGEPIRNNIDIYVYSIISTNPTINENKLISIIKIKKIRLLILYTFLSFIMLVFYLFIIIIISRYSLNPIYGIKNKLKNLEIFIGNKNNDFLFEENKIKIPNKEINELKEIYELMRKIQIIKNAFKKENFLNNYNIEFYNVTKNINKKYIKEICTSYLGFYQFKNKSYNLAEKEFYSTIIYLQEKENEIINKNNDYDDKIKDAIKRSTTEYYLNEYSNFEKLDENIFLIIKIKILKQRFIYLYAMTKYKIGLEMINHKDEGIMKNEKRYKDKKLNYFKEAINYFNDCKNINIILGINQIKVIYTLIMISKCYSQLNDYKKAMNNINEALMLFFELSKSFKDYHSKYYNPRIMIFIENNIFQYILYTISNICYIFNKPNASNWINLKIFETSPFIIENIHYKSGLMIKTYFENKKLKLSKSESKYTKKIYKKEIEKIKKYFSKFILRINEKYLNKNNILSVKLLSNNSIKTKNDNKISKNSSLNGEYQSYKSNFYINSKKFINKIITLCISEKIFNKINGMEFKDVIIKYFQKYFIFNENDKYNYIQFAKNGKITLYLKMEKLDSFLLKIQKAKNGFELSNIYETNSNIPFMELYNILDSIIKNYPVNTQNLTDNIVLMIMNSEDIRFKTMNDCISIVDNIKEKNVSLFLISFDEIIEPDKINNIHSFLNGLFEGHFFNIKNYQQLKQIFISISNNKIQSNFFGYDFEIFDNTL